MRGSCVTSCFYKEMFTSAYDVFSSFLLSLSIMSAAPARRVQMSRHNSIDEAGLDSLLLTIGC